jgi:hypothetical protein
MSEGAKEAFNAALDRKPGPLLPGLSLGKIMGDIGAEMGRLAVQGRAELAQALFSDTSNSYVPYGAGQFSPEQENENNRGGRSM